VYEKALGVIVLGVLAALCLFVFFSMIRAEYLDWRTEREVARALATGLRRRRLDDLVAAGASREAAERWVMELVRDLHVLGWHEAAELVWRLAFGSSQ